MLCLAFLACLGDKWISDSYIAYGNQVMPPILLLRLNRSEYAISARKKQTFVDFHLEVKIESSKSEL